MVITVITLFIKKVGVVLPFFFGGGGGPDSPALPPVVAPLARVCVCVSKPKVIRGGSEGERVSAIPRYHAAVI